MASAAVTPIRGKSYRCRAIRARCFGDLAGSPGNEQLSLTWNGKNFPGNQRIESHPKKRLADRVVTDDFLVRGVWIQHLPEIDISLLVTGYAGEQQAGRPNGQGVEMLNVF
jgi:hypothetical protein